MKAKSAPKPAQIVAGILRRRLGVAEPMCGVAGDDVVAVARTAFRAGAAAERKRSASLVHELSEVLEWARIEKAPLRQQEVESIRRVLQTYQGKGAKR